MFRPRAFSRKCRINWNQKRIQGLNGAVNGGPKSKTLSQGSVATHLRCGGIFSDTIITDFLSEKSLKIGQYLGVQNVPIFGSHPVDVDMILHNAIRYCNYV